MPAYEYMCLACEHAFEQRRSMSASVDTALACPSCGSERIRRRFSFVAGAGATTRDTAGRPSHGCACGGSCGC